MHCVPKAQLMPERSPLAFHRDKELMPPLHFVWFLQLQPCKKRKVFPESTIAIMFLAKNTAIVVEYPEPYDTVSVLRNGVDKLLLL